MAKTSTAYIAQAKKWLGLSRSAGTHHIIIDTYNAHKPLARGYAVTYSDAYCATFVSAAAIAAGMADIFALECGCEEQIKLWKKMGCWIEDESIVPKVGYIVYYDWQDTGTPKDNVGTADHVGVVTEVNGTVLKILEGNKGGDVAYRTIYVNQIYLRGYAAPKYDSSADAQTSNNTASTDYKKNFTVLTDLYMHKTPDKNNSSINGVLPEGAIVSCNGTYQLCGFTKMLYVTYKGKSGYASEKYLKG